VTLNTPHIQARGIIPTKVGPSNAYYVFVERFKEALLTQPIDALTLRRMLADLPLHTPFVKSTTGEAFQVSSGGRG
jgi:hypothetical protein